MTNNEAEYNTLIEALRSALAILKERGEDPTAWTLEAYGDSKLVINQVNGTWAARASRLLQLREETKELLKKFGESRLLYHPRSVSVEILGH